LATVREKQEQQQAIKIMTNSEKIGNKKRPRPVCGVRRSIAPEKAVERISAI
jgi:hypothetical protein